MAASAPLPDHGALIGAFLLTEYLRLADDPRLTPQEQYETRLRLDRELERQANLAPEFRHYVVRQLQSMFGVLELEGRVFAAVEWYLDYLTGVDETAIAEVNPQWALRCWKEISAPGIRSRAFRVVLLHDLVVRRDAPWSSTIARAFREAGGLEGETGLSPAGVEIASWLLREAMAAPRLPREELRSIRVYALAVLRMCLAGDYPHRLPPEGLVVRILEMAGETGEVTRREILTAFGR